MIYQILLLVSITSMEARAQQQSHLRTIANATNKDLNFLDIEEELLRYTWKVPYFNVLLRANHLESDAANPYVRWFLRQGQLPVVIAAYDYEQSANETESLATFHTERASFVIVTDLQQLHEVATRFVIQRSGTFLFVISDTVLPNDSIKNKCRNILRLLWIKYKAFQNFLLTFEGIFYFDPFDFDSTYREYGKVGRNHIIEPLERSLFRDMRGYPLRIQIFKSVFARPFINMSNPSIRDVYGVDGRVAELLQQRMNFTMILQEPDPNYFGERIKNGKYNGVIGSIIEDKIDFCLTGFFIKDYLVSSYMDFTVAVYDDKLCIYVPKARRIPQSILPIFSVRFDVWLSFFLTAFMCCLVWWLIRRLNIFLNIRRCADTPLDQSQWCQFVRIYTDTWVLWVRVTIVRYPPFNSERIFIAAICLVSVIFGAIFESSLATVFISPLYYNDINTLQELDKSNLKIIYKYSSMADDLFFSDTSPLFASLNKKLVYLNELNADVFLDIAKNGGKASVTRLNSVMLESPQFILEKQIYVVPECPKIYTISYVIPKDAPWKEVANDLLLQFCSFGLIKKWINDMKTNVDINLMINGMALEERNVFKVLTVNDLQLAFYVILMGNTLSAISFFVELCIKGWRKRIPQWKKDYGR